MSAFDESQATLRISGDTLVPSEISALLGIEANASQTKGEVIIAPVTGTSRVAKTGMWRLKALPREPEDLESQVKELLGQLTDDLAVWAKICSNFEIDLFCGLFMSGGNDGTVLSPAVLLALGERGIELQLDVYGPVTDDHAVGA